jgi:hypothetical protein
LALGDHKRGLRNQNQEQQMLELLRKLGWHKRGMHKGLQYLLFHVFQLRRALQNIFHPLHHQLHLNYGLLCLPW